MRGDALDFCDAVAAFDVEEFTDKVVATGADYVLFTSVHALQKLPAPSRTIDAILPGRTCRRDLIGELIRACRQHDMHFLLYNNHSCNNAADPVWEQAVGYHEYDKNIFVDNICSIVAE